jgi:large conductance mechanosensitive channel
LKKFIAEFKEFALRGNVIDLAVAVIIGNAINAIVKSLVTDIFTPVISLFIGRISIEDLSFNIKSSLLNGKDITITYGNFLQTVLNFLITAFCIFIMLKMINKLHDITLKRKDDTETEEPEPESPKTEDLLVEIRDLLKEQATSSVNSDLPDNLEQEHWHNARQSQNSGYCDTPSADSEENTCERACQVYCRERRKPRGGPGNELFESARGADKQDYHAAGKRRGGKD